MTEVGFMFDLDNDKMRQVAASFQTPAKPAILTQLRETVLSDDVEIVQIAQVIAQDVHLASSILKVINSPIYGLSRQISEIEQAVVFLGIDLIKSLATGLLLKEATKGNACISLERFWDDALEVAQAMRFVDEKVKHKVSIDMLYTVGLFYDCGIPLMATKHSDY